jgi:hypothetical protein
MYIIYMGRLSMKMGLQLPRHALQARQGHAQCRATSKTSLPQAAPKHLQNASMDAR